MHDGSVAMTYHTFMECPPRIGGLPGVAVRLGQALENWGRTAARPADREAQRRERERMLANEARILRHESLARQRP